MVARKEVCPKMYRLTICLALFTVGFVFTGCGGDDGPQKYNYSGTVTYDGKPIPKGDISFEPSGGNQGPGAMAKIVDGKYETAPGKGLISGPHKVIIAGWDGIPYEEEGEKVEDGRELFFPNYETTFDVPEEDGEKSFNVPKQE